MTELPAGQYVITGWFVSTGSIHEFAELVVGFPFTIEAGKRVYLGNFDFVGRLKPFGRSMKATLKSEAARDIPVIKKHFPVLATVPVRATIAPDIKLPLIGGYGQISDPPEIYVPMTP